ncbi:protein-disulfide reductase DsbD family protein [Phnomibacter sp. MR]|uniref:protein-disulfide reductase DsbD family protein n=1 Tax=Phnomibacter sp. MR TaxID=3042318 RepID=UPI003A7FE99C
MKKTLFALLLWLAVLPALAQQEPVQFTSSVQRTSDTSAVLIIKALLKDSLALFTSQPASADDPLISSIVLDSSSAAMLATGTAITENGQMQTLPDGSGGSYRVYKDSVEYRLPLRLNAESGSVSGKLVWLGMQGDEFPNGEYSFTASIPASGDAAAAPNTSTEEEKSMWQIFLEGFLAGLGAFIMPCIYAMVPVTVSFFTKRSKTRKQGIKNAAVYTASIIGIFTLIGFLITVVFGKGALNEMASSAWFNVGVFVLFMIFGISFLGAFEITLPASWSNKIDSKSGLNSYSGIFFLALTLVIVSFSCTVPFIGALTVLIAKGSFWAPLVGFFAFSLALSLPFAVFTIFPSLLNNMAKSGDWLNTIKVSLGFIELALALKFFSSADLAYHWGILDREVYLSLWIVIFGLLGLYLLGKLKFHHDNELPKNDYGQPYLSVTRLFFAIASLSFTVYMIPGLWGAPLNGISAWLPEMKTQDFKLAAGNVNSSNTATLPTGPQPKKYTDLLESEIPGVNSFFDYDEALAAAKALNKPLMIDFTGHSCANCRKMEREVLNNPEVMQRLQNDFVVVSLYVDDKFQLPENEWTTSKLDGKVLKRLGEKNLDFEVALTNNNAQPYYVFVDTNGKLLTTEGYGYNPSIPGFLAHLDKVKKLFSDKK